MIEATFASDWDPTFGYRSFIRLYSTGYAIECGIGIEAAEAPAWFDWSHDGVSRGRYSLGSSGTIAFELFSTSGSVSYLGTATSDALELSSVSHINGNRTSRRFGLCVQQ